MIGIIRLKRASAVAILCSGVVGVTAAVGLFGAVSSHFSSGGVREVQIMDEVPIDGSVAAEVTWQADVWHGLRPLDPLTRRIIAQVYSRAWLEITLHRAGTAPGVDPTFAGPALQFVKSNGATGTVNANGHELQLRFLSDDGTIIGLHSATSLTATVPVSGGLMRQETVDIHDVVLELGEDATWRIYQWERVGVAPTGGEITLAPVPTSTTLPDPLTILSVGAVALLTAGDIIYRRRRAKVSPEVRAVSPLPESHEASQTVHTDLAE